MSHIKFDYSKVLDKFVAPHEVEYMQAQVTAADELIRKGTGAGSDFLGWLDLPENYDREDRKSTRLNSSHSDRSRMPSSA